MHDKDAPLVAATLGKPSLKARLEAYYSLISPQIIANPQEWRFKFEQIYIKYGGTFHGEKKLASKLAKKYGTAIRLLVATDPSTTTTATTTTKSIPSPVAAFTTGSSAETENLPNLDQPFETNTKVAAVVTSVLQDDNNNILHDESWYELTPHEEHSGDVHFVSNRFDPIAALRTSEDDVMKQNPWIAECSRLDTVAQFALCLPKCDPQRKEPFASKRRQQQQHGTSDGESASILDDDNNNSKKKPRQLHPFEIVAQHLDTGPLSRLHEFRRHRVRIVIRYVNAIRGTLVGTLEAFDKHMNMILRDVEEVYCPRPVVDAEEEEEAKSNVERELERRHNMRDEMEPVRGKWSVKRRQMKHMLVRGDNVVLISKADEEQRHVTKSIYRRKKAILKGVRNPRSAANQTFGDVCDDNNVVTNNVMEKRKEN